MCKNSQMRRWKGRKARRKKKKMGKISSAIANIQGNKV
jgi:hypothetical protein